MAKKTLQTRQKLVFRIDPAYSKPRNPVALNAKASGAGSHKKPPAALRRAAKQALKKLPTEDESV
jgi:dsRNA-specific ribonuclease